MLLTATLGLAGISGFYMKMRLFKRRPRTPQRVAHSVIEETASSGAQSKFNYRTYAIAKCTSADSRDADHYEDKRTCYRQGSSGQNVEEVLCGEAGRERGAPPM